VDGGGFMSCQHDRTRGILHNGHALAFHCASFGFFLFKLKTTWLGSMKQLLTQTPAMLTPFFVCSFFIADKILIWRRCRMDKVHSPTQWQSITNTDR
jgi:hypothetical protein